MSLFAQSMNSIFLDVFPEKIAPEFFFITWCNFQQVFLCSSVVLCRYNLITVIPGDLHLQDLKRSARNLLPILVGSLVS